MRRLLTTLSGVLVLAACATPVPKRAPPPVLPVTLGPSDLHWLERLSFGPDSALIAEYQRLGRERFLERQLHPPAAPLPAPVAARIAAMTITHTDGASLLAQATQARRALKDLPEGDAREAGHKQLNEQGNQLALEARTREVLRALYSPAQLQEQMVWFWLNHFSVHVYKADVRWLVGDYEERAIRPFALGHFGDLVLATLTHPAMLQYLDNQHNAVHRVNENYARELMELHTLGVHGGYAQTDVTELARILTGVGIRAGAPPPRLRPEWQRLYLARGAFEFNPARHDFGTKQLLGQRIDGRGFDEVIAAVKLIVHQPACARFVSGKLAVYFVGDAPPPALIERMARTFERTDGDIAAVLATMFRSPEFEAARAGKFKDPMRFVVSALRLADDGAPISNVPPVINWLARLQELPFEHSTPDGYGLDEASWASPGQMSVRFETARAIGSGSAGLFTPVPVPGQPPDSGTPTGAPPRAANTVPALSGRLFELLYAPQLSPATREALAQARTPQEWNTFLLASPEFNHE